MKKWFETQACQKRYHCASCRNEKHFRTSLFQNKLVDNVDFECPFGLKLNDESLFINGKDLIIKSEPNEEWGPRKWKELHKRAIESNDLSQEMEWLDSFTTTLPCGECKSDWIKLSQENLPDLTNKDSYFAWTVKMHNLVNQKLNKPEYFLDQALKDYSAN